MKTASVSTGLKAQNAVLGDTALPSRNNYFSHLVGSAALLPMLASGALVDITIPHDGKNQPAYAANQDLRKFLWEPQTSTLTIVTGLDPHSAQMGDLWIDTNGNYKDDRTFPKGETLYRNPGYEFCFSLAPTTGSNESLNWELRELSKDSMALSTNQKAYSDSSPWKLAPSGADILLGSGTTEVKPMSKEEMLKLFDRAGDGVDTDITQGSIFQFHLDSKWLVPQNAESVTATFRLTEESGRDLLVGRTPIYAKEISSVPEPATVLPLAGLLLSGLAIRRRDPGSI